MSMSIASAVGDRRYWAATGRRSFGLLLSVRSALTETLTFRRLPFSSVMVIVRKLGSHRCFVCRCEWLIRWPLVGLFPVISHRRDICARLRASES